MAFIVFSVPLGAQPMFAAAAIRGHSRRPLSGPVTQSRHALSFLQKKPLFSAQKRWSSVGAAPQRWLIECKDVGREDQGANEDVPPEEKYPIPESSIDWNSEWKNFVEGGAVSKAKVPTPRTGQSGIRLPRALQRFQDGVTSRFRRSFGGRPSNTALLLLGGILVISFWFAFLDQTSLVPPGSGVL